MNKSLSPAAFLPFNHPFITTKKTFSNWRVLVKRESPLKASSFDENFTSSRMKMLICSSKRTAARTTLRASSLLHQKSPSHRIADSSIPQSSIHARPSKGPDSSPLFQAANFFGGWMLPDAIPIVPFAKTANQAGEEQKDIVRFIHPELWKHTKYGNGICFPGVTGNMPQDNLASIGKKPRASKPKTRNGCITCKWVPQWNHSLNVVKSSNTGIRIRRVKCDKGEPSCSRCVRNTTSTDGDRPGS